MRTVEFWAGHPPEIVRVSFRRAESSDCCQARPQCQHYMTSLRISWREKNCPPKWIVAVIPVSLHYILFLVLGLFFLASRGWNSVAVLLHDVNPCACAPWPQAGRAEREAQTVPFFLSFREVCTWSSSVCSGWEKEAPQVHVLLRCACSYHSRQQVRRRLTSCVA